MSTANWPGNGSALSALNWQGRLDAAGTEAEVVGAVRDYISELDHEEIAQLPDDCRPGKFLDASDVTSFAFHVVRRQQHLESESKPLTKLASFFSAASQRLSKVLAKSSEPEPAPPS